MKISSKLINLLCKPSIYCAVINKYVEPEASIFLRNLGCTEIYNLPFVCYRHSASNSHSFIPQSPQNNRKMLYYYIMDIASLVPVLALDVRSSNTILDMCAAPGGKAFAMLQVIKTSDLEGGGALALNDISPSRVKRLKDVVQKCVSRDVMHSVRITTRKGENWKEIEESTYDRVLVDVPCSADRHHVKDWIAKNKFYPNTEKFMELQKCLLLAALHSVKRDGIVVYSTCTMSRQENDIVVGEVMETTRKLGYKVDTVPFLHQSIERIFGSNMNRTEFGHIVIPSCSLNTGPMYTSKLHLLNK